MHFLKWEFCVQSVWCSPRR